MNYEKFSKSQTKNQSYSTKLFKSKTSPINVKLKPA